MKHERRPYVWIVERFLSGRWQPCLPGKLYKEEGRWELVCWQTECPDGKFRLRKYLRESNKCDL